MRSTYTICSEDRILDVAGAWDEFAMENEGFAACSANVIGRSLWDYIEGFEVQSFLNAIFFAVRMRGTTFRTAYRCDSPDIKRLTQMSVSRLNGNGLRVDHQLLRQCALPTSEVISESHKYARCSMCTRFKVGNEWVEAFVIPNQGFPAQRYVVCPCCKTAARKGLGELVSS